MVVPFNYDNDGLVCPERLSERKRKGLVLLVCEGEDALWRGHLVLVRTAAVIVPRLEHVQAGDDDPCGLERRGGLAICKERNVAVQRDRDFVECTRSVGRATEVAATHSRVRIIAREEVSFANLHGPRLVPSRTRVSRHRTNIRDDIGLEGGRDLQGRGIVVRVEGPRRGRILEPHLRGTIGGCATVPGTCSALRECDCHRRSDKLAREQRILDLKRHQEHVHGGVVGAERSIHVVDRCCKAQHHGPLPLIPGSFQVRIRDNVALDVAAALEHLDWQGSGVCRLCADEARDRERRRAPLEQRHVGLHPDCDCVNIAWKWTRLRGKGPHPQRHDVEGILGEVGRPFVGVVH
mmetsp:Transcript_46369/g.68058  ORF Transcript_46369/g.68058 Transcript_46369/m.68058 type:complete len:350 (-) Transcript_46369:755-1804(-)